jgi:aminoglycoside phosphotransferase (APT) family kinase protein
MREWEPELVVGLALAERLIRTQFPRLEFGSLRLLAEGWDNAVYAVDETWAFRFPQRSIAVAGVEREMALLPRLAPQLPLSIPIPVFVGTASDAYPWPFFGARLIPGREIADAALADADLKNVARPLGEFLRVLHSPRLFGELGAMLPIDPIHRSDMSFRAPRARARIAEVVEAGLWTAPPMVASWLEEAERLPMPAHSVVVHGDLHIRHVLIDDRRAIAGVIDWGDLAVSDPSLDLSLGWALFPPDVREEFLSAYGEVDQETRLRARVLALFLCAALAISAFHRGPPSVLEAAVRGLAIAAQP